MFLVCLFGRDVFLPTSVAVEAGFSIYIMVVGTLESFGTKASKDVTFQRMQDPILQTFDRSGLVETRVAVETVCVYVACILHVCIC